jgi:hypothetical protein
MDNIQNKLFNVSTSPVREYPNMQQPDRGLCRVLGFDFVKYEYE